MEIWQASRNQTFNLFLPTSGSQKEDDIEFYKYSKVLMLQNFSFDGFLKEMEIFLLILMQEQDIIMVQNLDYDKIAFQICMKKQLSFGKQSQTLYRQAEELLLESLGSCSKIIEHTEKIRRTNNL